MKRLMLLCGIALVFAGVAAAGTTTYTGTATYGQPFQKSFTTATVGDVMVSASWQPKKGARYVLKVKHLTDPSDALSYDRLCYVYENLSGNPQVDLYGPGASGDATLGNYSCSFSNAPVGYWTVEFQPISGKVQMSINISAP